LHDYKVKITQKKIEKNDSLKVLDRIKVLIITNPMSKPISLNSMFQYFCNESTNRLKTETSPIHTQNNYFEDMMQCIISSIKIKTKKPKQGDNGGPYKNHKIVSLFERNIKVFNGATNNMDYLL